ncbi:nuclear transport factor 2 family protein [Aurantiacibacter flavus]|uniref:Nuclear transport factor 2 family protein n=1 Tax=Aurantiacibacter flavus TaxID=3145232 RepID=A0ABV0CYK9_9SPHN
MHKPAFCFVAALLAGCADTALTTPARAQDAARPASGESSMTATPPAVAQDHEALIASDDPRLEANKRLVYDMYRIVLQGGYADRAGEFIREDYVQHNPNAAQGLAGIEDYIRSTRPERPLEDKIELPLINLVAEGDYVITSFVRREVDAEGETYYTTWFDMFRIEDGKIAEHWDPMTRNDAKIDPNSQRLED